MVHRRGRLQVQEQRVHQLVVRVLQAGPSTGQPLEHLALEAWAASREVPEVLQEGPSTGQQRVLRALEALEASLEELEVHRPSEA